MSTLKVTITGDAKGAIAAAKEAAEAAKQAAADSIEAAKRESDEAKKAVKEKRKLIKEQIEDAKEKANAEFEIDKKAIAAKRENLKSLRGEARKSAQDEIDQARAALKAKKEALDQHLEGFKRNAQEELRILKEVEAARASAAKAVGKQAAETTKQQGQIAAAATKSLDQIASDEAAADERAFMRERVMQARNERKLLDEPGSRKPGVGARMLSLGKTEVGLQALGVAASLAAISKVVNALDRFAEALEKRSQDLLRETLSANELTTRRAEKLRLAGVEAGSVTELGAGIGLLNPSLSSADIDRALDRLIQAGSGRISKEQVVATMSTAGPGTLGSALVATSYGLRPSDARTLAERYRLASRGGELDRQQGLALGGLRLRTELGADNYAAIADYLAAANETGADVQDIIASGSGLFPDDVPQLSSEFKRIRSLNRSTEVQPSLLERIRNQTEAEIAVMLASGDQATATETLEKEMKRRATALQITNEGPGRARAAQALLDVTNSQRVAESLGIAPERTVKVQVINQPKAPAEP